MRKRPRPQEVSFCLHGYVASKMKLLSIMINFAEECNVREEKNMKKMAENMKSEMFITKIKMFIQIPSVDYTCSNTAKNVIIALFYKRSLFGFYFQ